MPDTGRTSQVIEAICAWFDANGRDLPWRRPGTSAWGVLVSEVMSQQTRLVGSAPCIRDRMKSWPSREALAEEDSGEAVAAWGRLGYPRRALRLHSCAVAIATEHDGVVPNSYDELVALPGIGDYTASAVVSFAFGGRATVLDTNVRRLSARADAGIATCPTSVTRAERVVADALVPDEDVRAAKWAVASMELGALVCTARSPQCEVCPIRDSCRWVIDGKPDNAPARRGQPWKGTDRQCRGVIMDVVRNSPHGVKVQMALSAWPQPDQASRCLESLLDDGLVHRRGNLISL